MTPTDPETPQTADVVAWRAFSDRFMDPGYRDSGAMFIRDAFAAGWGAGRAARDAEIRAAVEGLPKWDKRSVPGGFHVNLTAILAILDADTGGEGNG